MKKIIIYLWSLLSWITVQAQEILPFTENFSKSDYLGENQIWNIVQASDHSLYFANNHYLLRYDGVVWEKKSLPEQTVIRSLYSKGNRIYSGSYREFGYFERVQGQLQYTSLTHNSALFKGESSNEEFWKIFEFDGAIYFQSFNELYRYDGKKIQKFRLPHLISYCYVDGNQLYVASVTQGIFTFSSGKLRPVKGWERLKGMIVHHLERIGDSIYIFTKNNGVFIAQGDRLIKWDHPLNSQIASEMILTAKYLSDNQLAIGTSLHGLYLIQLETGAYRQLNRANALRNNTVLSLFLDRENNLWLGMDNGIAHVEVRSPVEVFSDNSGALGTVYAMSGHEDELLLASNHGVFAWKNNILKQIPGSQGQAWEVLHTGKAYIIGHNDGTYTYDGSHYRWINSVNGGWNLASDRSGYLQTSYTGIYQYENADAFHSPRSISGLTKPIREVIRENDSVLWATDYYKGLYRLVLGKSGKTKVEWVTEGRTDDYNVRILLTQTEPVFLIQKQWYYFDEKSQSLQPQDAMNRDFSGMDWLITLDKNSFLGYRSGTLYRIEKKEQGHIWLPIDSKYYNGRLVLDKTRPFLHQGKQYVNLDDGFLVLHKPKPQASSPIRIEAYSNGEWVAKEGSLPFGTTITLRVLGEFHGFHKPETYYRTGENKKLIKVQGNRLELSNLSSGKHALEFFVFDGKEHKPSATFRFYVDQPWYFSWYMLLVYVLVIGSGIFIYYRWNRLRIQQQLKLQEEELRHQNELAQLQMRTEIEEKQRDYENYILELEVKSKTNEIAGKSLSIARQSEMIDLILEIVESEDEPLKLKSQIRKAIRNNQTNKQEWDSFQSNLQQMHDGFTARLLEQYPNLTQKDIQLCIYLRMNLSSKEIAPLMNISYRGVELQRYRLRKKMDLPTDTNLNQFMIKL